MAGPARNVGEIGRYGCQSLPEHIRGIGSLGETVPNLGRTFEGDVMSLKTHARREIEILRGELKLLGRSSSSKSSSRSLPKMPEDWTQQFAMIAPFLHPAVIHVSQPRFESGHFADAAEAAFKEFNDAVRTIVRNQTGEEFDGANLMSRAFSLKNPVITLADPGTLSGRNIQVGYMQIAAGAMTGIRNPKAHGNLDIASSRAVHFLVLASLLFSKLEERECSREKVQRMSK